MMKDLPFTVSPSAAAFIEEIICAAKSGPTSAGLVPGLGFAYNSTAWTEDKQIIGHIPDGHFIVGWYDPRHVSDFDRYRVAGTDLAISQETLDRLRGTNLELEQAANNGPMSRWLVARKY